MTTPDLTMIDAAALAGTQSDVALQMDEEAFRGFYERTSRMLWVYLQRLTNDRSAADDLLQETYYRFLRANVALDSESHRRHYLFRIATNLSHDRFRRASARPTHVSHDDATAADAMSLGSEAGHEQRIDLTTAMARLSTRERALLWLAYAQGSSHKEIAAAVGVGVTSVKPLLFRARRRLATLLGRRIERRVAREESAK